MDKPSVNEFNSICSSSSAKDPTFVPQSRETVFNIRENGKRAAATDAKVLPFFTRIPLFYAWLASRYVISFRSSHDRDTYGTPYFAQQIYYVGRRHILHALVVHLKWDGSGGIFWTVDITFGHEKY